ncbi:A/G-specific adenine glycosylase [Pacificimonas flava]|uniref:Adenine DNA glycosylase n=2 Tax=Pacificimonas TaxID=1960290 RepID=A0A219B7Z2_9SPHN|nr:MULTISPECIES: A/G-specific adenine glycosylase [Pacificimonas]MBZ6378469.1 A/G-specific adenine glycosylase [Pacificimonas aurantium]OWV34236.1 A/G-specific adenine glycosylase [Pacificimonas flava]
MSATDARAAPGAFQSALLSWYDRHARVLPWRVPPGSEERADPYRVWLSEVMLQQTVVKAAIPYFEAFTMRWPTVENLAAAPDEDILAAWAGLGYYARARNLIACARTVAEMGGFPDTEEGLRALPGLGPYTSASIAAIAFGRPATVVDGNIERVMARLFMVETPLPAAKPDLRAAADLLTPRERPGDYAQALMDLGAVICRPKAPTCLTCPVADFCEARGNAPERLPRKQPKQAKPVRHGLAYWAESRGKLLIVRRPPKGLLGGMAALPASDFTDSPPRLGDGAPFTAKWHRTGRTIDHVFTHFRLRLEIVKAKTSLANGPGEWVPLDRLEEAGLPTLFRKAVKTMLAAR